MYVAGYRQKAEIYLTYFVDVFSDILSLFTSPLGWIKYK